MSATKLWMVSLLLSLMFQFGCETRQSEQKPNSKSTVQEKKQSKKTSEKLPDALVRVENLKKRLGEEKLTILELGKDLEAFQKSHIPGALFVHWVNDITDLEVSERYNVAQKKAFEKLLQRLGISKDTHIILYDDMCSRLSTRMYWTLKYYGHDQVQVLDGGKSLWAKSQKMTDQTPTVSPSKYAIDSVRHEYKVGMKAIAADLEKRKMQLLDGRPPEQYSGEEPGKVFHTGTPHKKKGHIPGAVNICWKENFNDDGTFKSVKELKELYAKRGITTNQATVTYCNEGLHAAPPWFVLTELLDVKSVKLYDDSMCEWANSEKPVVKSKKKVEK